MSIYESTVNVIESMQFLIAEQPISI